MATIPSYPHYIGDSDDGNDVAAALSDPDSTWIVRPQLFFIWNPDEVYSRYIPCKYHVYSERRNIPGISQVYTMDIERLSSWIYGQVNAVIQSND